MKMENGAILNVFVWCVGGRVVFVWLFEVVCMHKVHVIILCCVHSYLRKVFATSRER